MTIVNCGFTDCIYNKDKECNKDKIYLDELVADINIGCPDAEWESVANLKEEFESAEYEDYEHATLVDIKEPLKVQVVRCKDCRWWQDSEVGVVECPICTRIHDMVFEMGADDFCSYGERREP